MKIETFITQNKDYKIEFIKKENYLSFSSSQFIYTINFINMYGTIVKSITLNDIEILILLDNFYAFIDMNRDLYMYIESKDSSCSCYVIRLSISEEISDNNIKYCKDTFILYNYHNEIFIPILQFEITDNIVEFMQKIYDIYYEDNIDIEYLNPSYLW